MTADSVTQTGLILNWSEATDNVAVTGYKVYQDDKAIGEVSGTTYSVTGLTADTSYTFKVEAGDAAGNWSDGGPSTIETTLASSGNNCGGTGSTTQKPTWPAGSTLTLGQREQTKIPLTWTPASGEVTQYKIYHGTSGVADTLIGAVDATETTYLDEKLQQGINTYIFKVEAGNSAGWTTNGPSSQIQGGTNPLIFDGAYLTTATPGSNTSDTGESVDGSTSVPVRPTIKFMFQRSVTQDAIWPNNQPCFTMKDSSGASVSISVFKISNGTEKNPDERRNIFIKPSSDLTPGETYQITISKNLKANNGKTLGEAYDGKDIVVSFTVAEGTVGTTAGGGATVITDGPTYTNGSGSVDPAVGATVGLGDLAKVVIPAKALQETGSVTVDVKQVTSPPAVPAGFKVAGEVYEFSVGGKTTYNFAKNVSLTFKFDPSQIGADEAPAIYYYDEAQAKWVNLGGTVSGSTITVQVDHFTKFAEFAVKKTEIVLNDITGHWAQNNIEKLVELGAVSGYPDGNFKPDTTITRAEFATILVKAFKLTPQSGKVFADTAGHWAKDNITTAASYGIVNGYEDGSFGPDDLITREQMAVMVVKAAKLDLTDEETSFADSAVISEWAKGAIATAVKNGIMKGYTDNTVQPRGNATRAEDTGGRFSCA